MGAGTCFTRDDKPFKYTSYCAVCIERRETQLRIEKAYCEKTGSHFIQPAHWYPPNPVKPPHVPHWRDNRIPELVNLRNAKITRLNLNLVHIKCTTCTNHRRQGIRHLQCIECLRNGVPVL
jgi:hypothetical protein